VKHSRNPANGHLDQKLRLDSSLTAGQHRHMKKSEQHPADSRLAAASRWPLILIAIGGLALWAAGCGTFDQSSAEKFASVIIKGNTPRQIRDVAADVFAGHGYKVVITKTNLICERMGSGVDNVAYGNWMSGEQPVYVRVRVEAVQLSQGTCRLQCLAYKVRDRGSFAFEEEVKVYNVGSHAYQKMLNEVADRLKVPKTPPP
jgi:hypothetical protein